MIDMQGNSGTRIIVLEPGNIEQLQQGRPIATQDKQIMIAWTPDPVWLMDKIAESDGQAATIGRLIDEAAKRPVKPSTRPYHPPHRQTFTTPEPP